MKRIPYIAALSVLAVLLAACQGTGNNENKAETKNPLQGKVLSVSPATKYIVMEIEGPEGTFWCATNQKPIKVGQTVQVVQAVLMKDFEVKSLKRTFPAIYFAQDVVPVGEDGKPVQRKAMPADAIHGNMAMHGMSGSAGHMADKTAVDASDVQPLADGVSIGKLLDTPASFAGKKIRLKGKVTKFLKQIMGKNWVHLKDATCGDRHLVLTTSDNDLNVGDVIEVEGTIVTDKDFGYGYKYAVLMEQATVLKR